MPAPPVAVRARYTAAAAAAGAIVVWQILLVATWDPGFGTSGWRLGVTANYFTVWSAVIAAGAWAAVGAGRSGPVTRTLWATTLPMMTVTFTVYWGLLVWHSSDVGWFRVTDIALHAALPAIAAALFVSGPRGWWNRRILAATAAVPTLWFVWVQATAVVYDTWPYPFLDPAWAGWPVVAGVAAVGLAAYLGAGAIWARLDRAISARPPAQGN